MQIAAVIITAVATALWVLLFLKGCNNKKYINAINHMNNSLYMLKDVYVVGFSALDMLKLNTNKGRMAKNVPELTELFGEADAKRHNRCLWAGKITLCLTFIALLGAVGLVAGEPLLCFLGVVVGPLMAYAMNNTLKNRILEKRERILLDFPQVVSKMAMLLKAGMTVQDAWAQIAFSHDSYIYQEMRVANQEIMNGGVSMEDAYLGFARRCVIPETRKFAILVIQNMVKGGSEMVNSLQEMAAEQWLAKKHIVLRKGELAGNKLLFPIMLMFIGVLILIMVPSFMSMSM